MTTCSWKGPLGDQSVFKVQCRSVDAVPWNDGGGSYLQFGSGSWDPKDSFRLQSALLQDAQQLEREAERQTAALRFKSSPAPPAVPSLLAANHRFYCNVSAADLNLKY